MTSFISHTTVDCANAYELSEWWKPVLGYVDIEGDPNLPGHEECMIRDPETGHQLLFIEVPDEKAVKNRLHLDLRPDDQAAEVARFESLGAVRVDIGQEGNADVTWVVLADPEGNEFCVLRPKKTLLD